MNRVRALLALAAALAAPAAAAQVLEYSGEWRFFDAGRVEAYLGASGARLSVATAGLADRLYPVRTDYSVTYDGAVCASATREDAREGSKHREVKVKCAGGKCEREERDIKKPGGAITRRAVEVPACVHDVLGALEKLRRTPTLPGQELRIPISDGRKSAAVLIQAQEKETIRTPAGVFTTVRHEAMLFNGVIFRRKARLFIWLTDDARRLPVQIQVRMPFYLGTVTLQLEKEKPG